MKSIVNVDKPISEYFDNWNKYILFLKKEIINFFIVNLN